MSFTADCRARVAGHAVAFVAAVVLALLAARALARGAGPEAAPLEGSLIAAFVTEGEILLMSDGRAVSSVDGTIVRDDLAKVHRLADRAGLLTAGRMLPDLVPAAQSRVAREGSSGLLGLVAAVSRVLETEWGRVADAAGEASGGRTFVFVAGFDEGGPRVFYFDTRKAPEIPVHEISVLGGGRELDVVAIASNPLGSTDASDVIVRHVSALYARNPGLSRRQILVAAFKAAQAEMSSYDARIGGQTFAAVIDPANGYQALDAGR